MSRALLGHMCPFNYSIIREGLILKILKLTAGKIKWPAGTARGKQWQAGIAGKIKLPAGTITKDEEGY